MSEPSTYMYPPVQEAIAAEARKCTGIPTVCPCRACQDFLDEASLECTGPGECGCVLCQEASDDDEDVDERA